MILKKIEGINLKKENNKIYTSYLYILSRIQICVLIIAIMSNGTIIVFDMCRYIDFILI
jgi:hypothetical protein